MCRSSLIVPALLCLLSPLGAPAQTGQPAPRQARTTRENAGIARPPLSAHASAPPAKPLAASALRAYGTLPLQFESNRGQTNGQVKYLTRGKGFTFFLTPSETVLALRRVPPRASAPAASESAAPAPESAQLSNALAPSSTSSTQSVLRIELAGGNRSPKIEPQDRLPGITNYFIGSDPSRWRTNIPNYARVLYRQVYPGINAAYYGKEGRLETDFIVAPGKDPGVIRMKFTGAKRMEVDSAGDLVLTTATGDVKLARPVLYQDVKGERREVSGGYRLLSANEAGFSVGTFDSSRTLVIDPTLVYSTYLGGSGSRGDDAQAITVDAAGEAYVTGAAASTDFPLQSPKQGTLAGTENAYVTKFAANGTSLIFSTFLGGSNIDHGSGIAIDAAGEPYITGRTTSTNFPTTRLPGLNGGADAFVAKLSADGSMLLFSFYLGGENNDDGGAIAVDQNGDAYVTGFTDSLMFPTTRGAFQGQGALGGFQNHGFVAKITGTGRAMGTVAWATYLGGNNNDEAKAIAVDRAIPANVYVAGTTNSTTFPVLNAFQNTLGGPRATNVFVSELNPTGTALVYSTYLGGSGFDDAGGIAVDSGANFIVAGDANSGDFPIVNSLQAKSRFGDDVFVAKFAPSGASLLFSSLFGDSTGSTEARALALDSSDNIYVTGLTDAVFMPTLDPLQGTTSPSPFDFDSVFVVEFKSDGSDYLFSTFLGGSSNVLAPAFSSISDVAAGIAVDPSANIYITGTTMTSDFPTVNPFQAALKSPQSNAFVSKISPLTPAGPQIFPPALLLSSVPAGQRSAISVVTIANGTNTLAISAISISGPNSTDFSQTNSCGSTLVARVVCTIVVTFTPSAAGPRAATLDIFDSDPTTPHTAISLTATATTPPPPPQTGTLTVTPSSLTFGNQEVSVPSAPQTLTVSNPGNVAVTVTLTTTGANRFDYFGTFGTPCFNGGTIAAGANCTVDVRFTPTATGNSSATLQFSGNFTGSPILITVSGVGTPKIATLMPASINFANQVINTTSAPQSFTLTNTSSTQTLSNIVVSPFSGGDFAKTTTCTATLAPNTSCSISVTFTPTAAGFRFAPLTVTDSDPASQNASVQGTGLNLQATLAAISPLQLLFGRQTVGTTSPPNFVFLLNTGNTDLVFTISITGANSAEFAASNSCGGTIVAGGACDLQVTFTPTAVGARLAKLTVNSSTAGVSGVPQSVNLSGTGANPTTASLAPNALTFPNQAVGSTSAPLVVTFSNNGARPLVAAGATITGLNAGDFAFTTPSDLSTTGCGGLFFGTYNPQVACPIVFTFTPSGSGNRTALFTLKDSSGNSPHTVMLNGTAGNGPAVSLSSTSVQFPPQAVGTTSSTITVTLTNTGNANLILSMITLTGPNFADFMTPSTTCINGLTVPSSGSCVFNFTFKPSTTSAETATVTITDNASGSPHSINLMGTGTTAAGPVVTLSPTSLTFGNQVVGTTSSPAMTVMLSNTGNAALTITSITATGDFAQTNPCPAILAAGANCIISVTFTPTAAGNRTGAVNILDSASGSPHMVPLSGIGTAVPAPAVTLSPTSLDFGASPLGTPLIRTVTLTNSGNAGLHITSIVASTGDFSQTNNCPGISFTITPGGSCVITVTFTPTVPGNRSGTVTIVDNASSSPDMIPLTGLGGSPLAGFTFGPSSGSGTSVTLHPGDTGTFSITFTPNPGFVGTVNFTCVAPIPNTICAISPSTLSITSSAPVTLTLTLRTNCTSFLLPLQMPRALPPGWGVSLGLLWMLALGGWLWSLKRNRDNAPLRPSVAGTMRWLVPSLALALLVLTWTGCGSSATPAIPGAPVTPAGSYNITLTGSAVGGASQSINFSVRVI